MIEYPPNMRVCPNCNSAYSADERWDAETGKWVRGGCPFSHMKTDKLMVPGRTSPFSR